MKEKSIGNNLQETLNREDNKEDVFQAFLQNNNICLKPLLFVNLFLFVLSHFLCFILNIIKSDNKG